MQQRLSDSNLEALTAIGAVSLAVLVLTRTAVSFQFQSVTPLLPVLEQRSDIDHSTLGLLLGLYMAPGAAVALILPLLLKAVGRPAVIGAAIATMAAGEVCVLLADSFAPATAGRFLGGIGGCVIYIATINMVADLQHAGTRSGRMGLIAASWPLGNALALLLLGALVDILPGLAPLMPLGVILCAGVCIFALFSLDRRAGGTMRIVPMRAVSLGAWWRVLRRIHAVALSFAVYNIGFIVLTAFSPRILVDAGFGPVAAAGTGSIPMWMFLVSVPLGGQISGRILCDDVHLVVAGCLTAALCVLASGFGAAEAPLYAIAGFVGGLPTAPILSRARVISGETADITYSALFLVFFVLLMVIPPLIGWVADFADSTRLILPIVSLLLALAVLLFVHSARQPALEA